MLFGIPSPLNDPGSFKSFVVVLKDNQMNDRYWKVRLELVQ